jgi:excinuclease UvrABC ATPase subunit
MDRYRVKSSNSVGGIASTLPAEGFTLDSPWRALTDRAQKTILYGADDQVHVRYDVPDAAHRAPRVGDVGVLVPRR